MFGGAVLAAVEEALRRWRGRGTAVDPQGHRWERICTTVVLDKPMVVEYRCQRCGAWTVEERTEW